MSHLDLTAGVLPDFIKGTISVWFKVPQSTLDAGLADYNNRPFPDNNFIGIVSLVTWGFQMTFEDTATPANNSPLYSSFLGIRCGPAFGPLDDGDHGDGHFLSSCLAFDSGGFRDVQFPDDTVPGSGSTDFYLPFGGWTVGSLELAVPQSQSLIEVTADEWHHLLFSFDLSNGANMSVGGGTATPTVTSKCWLAYDDTNYNGDFLAPYGAACFGDGSDANGIVTAYCMEGNSYNGGGGFTATDLPASGGPTAIPNASGVRESYVYQTEMAELQFFTDVTLDTSVEGNRRAFVDKDGAPVSPDKQATDTDAQSGSIELLGKRPDILLHGKGNWINGINTGHLVPDPDNPDSGNLVPDPHWQFTVTGEIDPRSGPSLSGGSPPIVSGSPGARVRLSGRAPPIVTMQSGRDKDTARLWTR